MSGEGLSVMNSTYYINKGIFAEEVIIYGKPTEGF
jgi:hypothetical protein